MNTRRIGAEYEDRAAAFLTENGFDILARNYRVAAGEIDIVARGEGYLVFAEVKYRVGGGSGFPEEAVNLRKQRQISKVALYYLNQHGYPDTTPVRFDVLALSGDEIRHIRNAFPYQR